MVNTPINRRCAGYAQGSRVDRSIGDRDGMRLVCHASFAHRCDDYLRRAAQRDLAMFDDLDRDKDGKLTLKKFAAMSTGSTLQRSRYQSRWRDHAGGTHALHRASVWSRVRTSEGNR
jgi:hypothetical protein